MELSLFEKSPEPNFVWERHAVRIRWGSQTVDFLMGMRVRGEVHWWEACRLVVREESPLCRIVEVGNAIPHTQTVPVVGIPIADHPDRLAAPWEGGASL